MCAGGNGVASVTRAGAGKLLVSPHCRGDGRLEIGQLYSPVWRIAETTGFPRDEGLASSAEDY